LDSTETKLKRLLKDFSFGSMEQALAGRSLFVQPDVTHGPAKRITPGV